MININRDMIKLTHPFSSVCECVPIQLNTDIRRPFSYEMLSIAEMREKTVFYVDVFAEQPI